MSTVDAVVIGSGPNGLVAAAAMADAGWDVTILEAAPTPGGAVRSEELFPGFRSDLFSAFYPLAAVSPALAAMELEAHGLTWSHARYPLGHARSPLDDDAPVIHPDSADTAAELERRHPGDGKAWLDLVAYWHTVKAPLLKALFTSFPPIAGSLGLLRALGTGDTLRFARFLALPARRMAHELFGGEAARVLLLGNAMHSDVPPDAPGSGVMGFLLTMLAQDTGYPVPVGGAGELSAAMVRRATTAGAELRCGDPVVSVEVRSGRVTGVVTDSGRRVSARHAVVADVSAPALFGTLVAQHAVPSALRREMSRFEWDTPVVKVNYALNHRIPWRSSSLSNAGTVHLGADDNGLVRWMADLGTGVVPQSPFLLFGQMTTADPSRSPEGTESAWAYTHLPRGVVDDDAAALVADRVDDLLEAHAPGFADSVTGRSVQRPSDLEAANANLVGGAVNGGTAQLHQQLIFRNHGRAETPITGLFLGSASAHPGGGVHGVCGLNAAKAALRQRGPQGWIRRRTVGHLMELLTHGE